MRFVLDNSVVMRWLLHDGRVERLAHAQKVLAELSQQDRTALVPGIWALEAANVMVKAQARLLVTEARSAVFARLLQDARGRASGNPGWRFAQRHVANRCGAGVRREAQEPGTARCLMARYYRSKRPLPSVEWS